MSAEQIPIARGYIVEPAANGGWLVRSFVEFGGPERSNVLGAFTGRADLLSWLGAQHELHADLVRSPPRRAITRLDGELSSSGELERRVPRHLPSRIDGNE